MNADTQNSINRLYDRLSENEEVVRRNLALAYLVGDEFKSMVQQELDFIDDIRHSIYLYEQTEDMAHLRAVEYAQTQYTALQERMKIVLNKASGK